jgi:phosphoketolase
MNDTGAKSVILQNPLDAEELRKTHAYWRACHYVAAGMIYQQDNPLLKEPLKPEHIKNRLLGHWGASPGLAFMYVHLNRLIRKYFVDLKIRFINVVDLFRMQPAGEHPHGLSDRDFDSLFTVDKPIIFNFHGYPWLIHRLAYRRTKPGDGRTKGGVCAVVKFLTHQSAVNSWEYSFIENVTFNKIEFIQERVRCNWV